MSETRWFTVEEIADLLRVHVNTVRRWIRDGQLQAISFGGKTGYRIRQSDLDDFIARKERAHER